ncbi:unnamed protein product [Amoebophrya sp. A120]|nr:unnamed protein product [Amoebophrya sp. A120]|eukprot:GSA120T00006675001.1
MGKSKTEDIMDSSRYSIIAAAGGVALPQPPYEEHIAHFVPRPPPEQLLGDHVRRMMYDDPVMQQLYQQQRRSETGTRVGEADAGFPDFATWCDLQFAGATAVQLPARHVMVPPSFAPAGSLDGNFPTSILPGREMVPPVDVNYIIPAGAMTHQTHLMLATAAQAPESFQSFPPPAENYNLEYADVTAEPEIEYPAHGGGFPASSSFWYDANSQHDQALFSFASGGAQHLPLYSASSHPTQSDALQIEPQLQATAHTQKREGVEQQALLSPGSRGNAVHLQDSTPIKDKDTNTSSKGNGKKKTTASEGRNGKQLPKGGEKARASASFGYTNTTNRPGTARPARPSKEDMFEIMIAKRIVSGGSDFSRAGAQAKPKADEMRVSHGSRRWKDNERCTLEYVFRKQVHRCAVYDYATSSWVQKREWRKGSKDFKKKRAMVDNFFEKRGLRRGWQSPLVPEVEPQRQENRCALWKQRPLVAHVAQLICEEPDLLLQTLFATADADVYLRTYAEALLNKLSRSERNNSLSISLGKGEGVSAASDSGTGQKMNAGTSHPWLWLREDNHNRRNSRSSTSTAQAPSEGAVAVAEAKAQSSSDAGAPARASGGTSGKSPGRPEVARASVSTTASGVSAGTASSVGTAPLSPVELADKITATSWRTVPSKVLEVFLNWIEGHGVTAEEFLGAWSLLQQMQIEFGGAADAEEVAFCRATLWREHREASRARLRNLASSTVKLPSDGIYDTTSIGDLLLRQAVHLGLDGEHFPSSSAAHTRQTMYGDLVQQWDGLWVPGKPSAV